MKTIPQSAATNFFADGGSRSRPAGGGLTIDLDCLEQRRGRGIIIADSKFEFGLDAEGDLVLIDEALTPDSSRFWPADSYAVGPPSFDKQFVRDYLERLAWDKKPPAPRLPPEIIEKTAAKYREAQSRLIDVAAT